MATTVREIVERAVKVMQTEGDDATKNNIRGTLMILSAFARAVEICSKRGTPEERQSLKADALSAYRDFIAPLDLPGVPNYLEPLLDSYLEGAIGAGIEAGFSRLDFMQGEIDKIVDEAKAA